jgi:hypothetical protein
MSTSLRIVLPGDEHAGLGLVDQARRERDRWRTLATQEREAAMAAHLALLRLADELEACKAAAATQAAALHTAQIELRLLRHRGTLARLWTWWRGT